jgi:ABC-type Zn uptake system ZnuABC Zn-binding protein ZnuA
MALVPGYGAGVMRRLVPLPLALLLFACGADDEGTTEAADAGAAATPSGGAPLVVATTTQIADFVRVLGGDAITVHQVLPANADAHDYEPSPADLDAMARADLVVRNGIELEEWFDETFAASGSDAVVVTAADGIELREGGEHEEERDADEEHAEEEGEPDGDPHVWFDPENAKAMVRTIAAGLTEVDPDSATAYAGNLDAYIAELDELDAYAQERFAALDNRKVITNHDAFGYLFDRYDLELVGAVIPSSDTSAEPSAADVQNLIAAIEREGVSAIFTEASLPADLAESIAEETDVAIVSGDDALYSDSLGPEGSSGATYLDMMRHNIDTLADNLG